MRQRRRKHCMGIGCDCDTANVTLSSTVFLLICMRRPIRAAKHAMYEQLIYYSFHWRLEIRYWQRGALTKLNSNLEVPTAPMGNARNSFLMCGRVREHFNHL